MKVFLDDERATPEGWVRCYWPDEVIELLYSGEVAEVSLDHDLGDDARGTGYDVLLWIEEAVAGRGWTPPMLSVHSANTSARQKMDAAIAQIGKLKDAQMIIQGTDSRGISSLTRFLKSLHGLYRHPKSQFYCKIAPNFPSFLSLVMEPRWASITIGNVFARNSSKLDFGAIWFERKWRSGIWKPDVAYVS